MPYFVASIIAVVSAMVVLFSRYEADNSSITAELEKMKGMFSIVDSFVNTYIDIGESTATINFEKLEDEGILISGGSVTGTGNASTLELPNDKTIWQIIPTKGNEFSSYKLLVDFNANSSLMSKSNFSESFMGREYCQKMLFGEFVTNGNSYNGTDDFTTTGNKKDGKLVCIVSK